LSVVGCQPGFQESVVARRIKVRAHRYQDLLAWQKAIEFVQAIYAISSKFPQKKMFGLKSQLRRAAVSVPSNIAEGQGRASRGEFLQFLGHARGSLYEIETQIVIAPNLRYFSAEDRDLLLAEAQRLGRILNALIASLKPSTRTSALQQLTTDN
jgi:four helix bundle protein